MTHLTHFLARHWSGAYCSAFPPTSLPDQADTLERLRTALAGRYQIDEQIGWGGMAGVYLATDLKHRRKVAIKVMRSDLGFGAARFLREIEISAKLVHPNILGLHDSGEADGLLFFVMPYVDGGSLRARLGRDRRLPLEAIVAIARDVAGALDHAHAHGVIHRDIKPENVLFEAGHAVVADFGIASAASVAGDDTLTATGVIIGTVGYMSPEQALGEKALDSRSDVYGLAAMVYEMISGRRAFEGATPQAVLAKVLTEDPAGVRSLVRDVSPAVDTVLRKAMAKSPADRYATAGEFADALRAAAGATGGHVVSPLVSRKAALAAGVVLLLAAAGVAIWQTGDASAASVGSIAVMPFDSPGADSTQTYFVDGMHDALIGELGRFGALRVISRTSVMRFRGANQTLSAIADSLGVDAIVEAAVYRLRDSVRIQLRLVRAKPEERQLWSHSYGSTLGAVLALPPRVARDLATQVGVDAMPPEQDQLAPARQAGAARGPRDPAVNDLYLEGRHWLNRRTAEGLRRAETAFRKAVALDSNFAEAHASLASTLALIADWHYDRLDPIAVPREALVEAGKALALDSMSGEALAARARVMSASGAPKELVTREFERAIRAVPQHANARGWFGMDLAWQGRLAESRAQNDTSIALDPLAPGRRMGSAVRAINSGEPETSLQEARRIGLLEPGAIERSNFMVAVSLVLLGRAEECLTLRFPPGFSPVRAICLHAAGHTAEAQRLIDSVAARTIAALTRDGPYQEVLPADFLPMYYGWIGDVDQTLRWSREATRLTPATTSSILINSGIFDKVRRDPRFVTEYAKIYEDLWRRINTPPLIY